MEVFDNSIPYVLAINTDEHHYYVQTILILLPTQSITIYSSSSPDNIDNDSFAHTALSGYVIYLNYIYIDSLKFNLFH